MKKMNQFYGLCLALSAVALSASAGNAASHVACPPKSDFTQEAAETLFQNRTDPSYRVTNPDCDHRATYTVTDSDDTVYDNREFVVGANPGDTIWRYPQYTEDETGFRRGEGISLAGFNALLDLADRLALPLGPEYSPSSTEALMSLVGAEYADDAPDAVAALSAYFTNPGETAAQREANRRQAQEGMDALLALSGVSVTCATLSSRPKYKSPSCPGATGAFDLIGCQYNYDDSVAVRKRGKVRVVFYREGYRGQHQHAIASRRYLCSDSGDRGDLQSWFSTPAFRHLCRREDWDIPYQTSNYTCQ